MEAKNSFDTELGNLRLQVPGVPDLAHTLGRSGAQVLTGRLPAGLVFAVRVAGLLASGALLFVAFQIAGTRSRTTLVRLTQLKVVNEAWSAANGYVLSFTVYDDDPGNKGHPEVYGPNYIAFKQAAYKWADAYGIKRPQEGEEVWDGPKMGLFLMHTGGGTSPDLYRVEMAQVNLRTDDPALCDKLVEALAQLPGVADPKVQKMTMYFGMGGLTSATENAKVIINGTEYDFPEDFSPQEAQDAYWALQSFEDNPHVSYLAFADKFLAEDLYAPRPGFTTDPRGGPISKVNPTAIAVRRRFKLGDVFRMGVDQYGNLKIDTYQMDWNVPAGTFNGLGLHGKWGGWGFELPLGTDESKLNVLEELSRKFDPLPGDRDNPRYYASLQYWVYPLEKVKSEGGRAVTPQVQTEATAMSSKLMAAFAGWKAQHPELRRSLVYDNHANAAIERFGNCPIAFTASLSTDDLNELESLKSALSSVTGAPVPVERIQDRAHNVKRGALPAPLK
jgi:hypothetical protein